MKYIDGFRDPKAARALVQKIIALSKKLELKDQPYRIMEVCGSHTMAIGRFGIRSVLPKNIDLISGPGCPVCVTDAGYIDAAIKLAQKGAIIATFGDMVRVPGSEMSLAECRAAGGDVEICYSPKEALTVADNNPDRDVVFLAIGFETTVAPVISLIAEAERREIRNLTLLTSFRLVPPALEALAVDPDLEIDGLLCPAHVSTVIGVKPYEEYIAKYPMPCVIAGFESLDILYGIEGILNQWLDGQVRVENHYSRVVKPQGNQRAQQLIEKYLRPADLFWRGLGLVAESGLELRPEYSAYDAEKRHGIKIPKGRYDPECKCGDVIKGKIKPFECSLFGSACTPAHPMGPCMVSEEGSCSAYYKYGKVESGV